MKFILINVYGPNSIIGKKVVWDEISMVLLEYKDSLIILGGDFNTIVSLDEKVGGSQHLTLSSIDFKLWIDKHCLLEIPSNNDVYTWNNKRMENAYISKKARQIFYSS